jgi:hypothetical protein
MAVASVPFGSRHFKAGHTEVLKEPRRVAIEELLAMSTAGIDDNAEGKQGAQTWYMPGSRCGCDSLGFHLTECLSYRRKIDIAEIDLGCLNLEGLHLGERVPQDPSFPTGGLKRHAPLVQDMVGRVPAFRPWLGGLDTTRNFL